MKILYPRFVHPFLILFSLYFPTCIVAQTFQWTSVSTGQNYQFGRDIAVDQSGNVYVTGDFEGTIQFDNYSLQSAGGKDIFLVKYDQQGKVLWAKRAGGTSDDIGRSVITDKAGDVYITGSFTSVKADFNTLEVSNSETVVDANSKDFFLTKYSPVGEIIWVKAAKGNSIQEGLDLAIDNEDNVYATGVYFFGFSLDTIALYNDGHQSSIGVTSDLFVVKFNKAGDIVLGLSSTGSGFEHSNGIAVDRWQNIYLTGYFIGNFLLNTASLNNNNLEGFTAKLNADGKEQWIKSFGGTYQDIGHEVGVDVKGNIYVTGSFNNTANFGDIALTGDQPNMVPSGFVSQDVFLVKYHTDGTVAWAKRGGGYNGSENGYGIAVEANGNCYVTGDFATVSVPNEKKPGFDDVYLSSCLMSDIFVSQYDTDGNVVKVAKAGGSNEEYGLGIALDPAGNCFITGELRSYNAYFGSGYITASGQSNVFTTRLNNTQWQYADVTLAVDKNIACNQNAFPVDFTIGCASFPFNPLISIEISEVNSGVFPGTPTFIGQGNGSPIQCHFPENLVAGKYKIRAYTSGEIKSNEQEITLLKQSNTLSIQLVSPAICSGQEISFTAVPEIVDDTMLYQWKVDGVTYPGTSHTFSFKTAANSSQQSIKIEAEASSSGACTLYAWKVFDILPSPAIACTIEETIMSDKEATFKASASGGSPPYIYSWDFGDGRELITQPESEVSYTYSTDGIYHVTTTVMDSKGCTVQCKDEVKVEINFGELPNVFTPNGDQKNDSFTMDYRGNQTFEMLIYNRWGKLIATSNNGINGWDGQNCNPGIYYYLIKVGGQQCKGWVQLLK